ncbi:putative Ig domain-containing protein [Leucobacter sp. cx-328]|uniref:Ig domain-containing protein n=1 Tax=unclassified Leucobacter TaxID=2621730 RepID=UPI00165E8BFE|nr:MULTISPECIES: Ig domain-containing protein [unclassified Leucobacter]MBC9943465.1 putative Ig domain-containing protein [Leucobacter sp. cx-328]
MKMRTGLSIGAVIGTMLLGVTLAPANAAEVSEVAPADPSPPSPDMNVEDPRILGGEQAAVSDALSIRIPVMRDPALATSTELENAQPWSLTLSRTGTYAYATSRASTDTPANSFRDLYVFDLESRKHVKTIRFDVPGQISPLSAARDADVLAFSVGGTHVFTLNTLTNELVGAPLPVPSSSSYRDTISTDGQSYYMADVYGTVRKLDLSTGTITASQSIGVDRTGSITLSADGNSVIVGSGGRAFDGASITVLNAATLAIENGPNTNFATWQFDRIRSDLKTGSLFSTGYSWYVERYDPNSGALTGSVAIARYMNDFIVDPRNDPSEGSAREDRAWGLTTEYDLVAPAIFGNEVAGTEDRRSDSFRDTDGVPIYMDQRATCADEAAFPESCTDIGEIVVSNGGGSAPDTDNSITVLLPPVITTQPLNAAVTRLGDSARFAVRLDGVKPDAASNITWQSSPDGTAWTDLDEHSTTLDVEATEESVALQYRLAYVDDFWNVSGASEPVSITGPAPVITSQAPQNTMRVGEPITPITLSANAQGKQTWSIDGLPAGVTFNANSKLLSGTPTEAGNYTVVATVTDAFGSATQTVDVTVEKAAPGPDPEPKPDPKPKPEPKPTPGNPGNGGDTTGASNLAHTGGAGLTLVAGAAGLLTIIGAGAVFLARRGRA